MSLSKTQMRSHIFLVILDKFSSSTERRQEALTEYLLVTLPNISKETAAKLAGLIPDILPELYAEWIDQFVEKLFETIPDDQLQHLCSGSVENNAALSLVFLMFMESERMERQMEDDLRRYALQHSGSGDMGDLVAAYLRGKVDALREEVDLVNTSDHNGGASSAAMAHISSTDPNRKQTVAGHLLNVSMLTQQFASKVNMPLAGKLLGLLHDFGKYSTAFQNYLFSANGLLDQDSDDFIDPISHKGKIDHSTAGAQYIWKYFSRNFNSIPYAQMLSLCIASHHSGLIDCISPNGEFVFLSRMKKDDAKTNYSFCKENCDENIRSEIKNTFSPNVMREAHSAVYSLRNRVKGHLQEGASSMDKCDNENSRDLQQGLLTRFLLSCLLDADRIDSAEFEDSAYKVLRAQTPKKPWARLLSRLNKHLESFEIGPAINDARQQISEECEKRGSDPRGLFTLSVPTGGGKTLASLRFALCHAKTHDLDRIVYIIPYTSIIDQNAQVARSILEVDEESGPVVLEHHSNILPEKETWQNKLLAENWDAPVIFTTMVQFLDSLFASGTRSARRMHNLARSVLIFDEIQTLPVKCVHLFCNALNFLVENCGSSAILCTATQPRLDNVSRPCLGSLRLDPKREIISDVPELFLKLRRTNFVDHCEKYMSEEDIADLALKELRQSGSCLVVCNTKKWAEKIYTQCVQEWGETYYLSTNLCPAHRLDKLEEIRRALDAGNSVLCVSTQLIECGVDVNFGSAIRLVAGLDSILQTAGRCNRHGDKKSGRVHIVKVREEKERLDSLPDIKAGRDIYLDKIRIGHIRELEASGYDLTHPKIISAYFEHYYQHRSKLMTYAVQNGERDDTLVNMLGKNRFVPGYMKNCNMMRQSFATAGKCFQVIDTSTQSIIVPYKNGKKIIESLYSSLIFSQKMELLREAQRYTVNIFPHTMLKLEYSKALRNIQQSGILCLDACFYDDSLGVANNLVAKNRLDTELCGI